MGKQSVAESPHSHAHGNQSPPPTDGSSPASASREIFQGLFKDLGKQAMALESILRLVCGRVDKLEHWVTEMSFGMTELDLKLRNIAHNIEGTAANVDDVPPVSRWSEPQEEDEMSEATVIKKVGVGLNKKKQMRMTGMVANILDQLTTVAETPTAAESESESHHDKKRVKAKTKKPRDTIATPPGGVSASTTPRDGTKPKKPHKKTAHRLADDAPTPSDELNLASLVGAEANGSTPVNTRNAPGNVVGEHPIEANSTREDSAPVHAGSVNEIGNDHPDGVPMPHFVHQDSEVSQLHIQFQQTEQEAQDEPLALTVQPLDSKPTEANVHEDNTPLHKIDEVVDDAVTKPSQEQVATDLSLVPANVLPIADSSADLECNTMVAETPPSLLNDGFREVPTVSIDVQSLHQEPNIPSEPFNKPSQPPVPHPDNELPQQFVLSEQAQNDNFLSSEPVNERPAVEEIRPSKELAVPQPHTVTLLEPSVEGLEPAIPRSSSESSARVADRQTGNIPVDPLLVDAAQPQQPLTASVTRSNSKKILKEDEVITSGQVQLPIPAKKGSRRASIRKSVSQRQPSLMKKHSHKHAPSPLKNSHAEEPSEPLPMQSISTAVRVAVPLDGDTVPTAPKSTEKAVTASVLNQTQEQRNDSVHDDSSGDDSDEDDSSSQLSSDSDDFILDLDERTAKRFSPTLAESSAADKKMTMKMTRTLTALNKLKKANVLTPEEIAELRQRANQKWFKLRDHIKEKNKKDVANILLKRKKNIFTVSNRIELLEEKSREVYASIKQLNADLRGKVEASTFEGLRRHVHDIHVSLQSLDEKTSKGNIPSMDHIRQLARDTEAMRVAFQEELQFVRQHCETNHQEALRLFEEEWKRVSDIEASIRDKLALLAAEYDDKLHELPDYTDALEGIRRAIRKKADLKLVRELEARLLGQDADSEDCLIRCLSCHKEVMNPAHDSVTIEDAEAPAIGSPHLKRVNPSSSSARVYRSNIPLNAHPQVISDPSLETLSQPLSDEAAAIPLSTSRGKALTQLRRTNRNEEAKPSPLSFIYVAASRAITEGTDVTRPISAPASALKKKPQPKS